MAPRELVKKKKEIASFN